MIGGIPVQFLIFETNLELEAINNAVPVVLFEVETFILKAEYLMAIMLQVNRSKDKAKLSLFLDQCDYDQVMFNNILIKYNLLEKFNEFIGK